MAAFPVSKPSSTSVDSRWPGRIVALLLLAAVAPAAKAIEIVDDPSNITAVNELFGVRERNLVAGPNAAGGDEVYVGVADLGEPGSRSAADLIWAKQSVPDDFTDAARNFVRVTYDQPTDTLTQTVTPGLGPPVSVGYENCRPNIPLFQPNATAGDANGLVLRLRGDLTDPRPSIIISDFTVEGVNLGDFALGPDVVTDHVFYILAPDTFFRAGSITSWEFSFSLFLHGDFPSSQEAFRAEALVSEIEFAPIPEPSLPVLLAVGAAALGLRRRKCR